jgi:HEAT repeat protein
MGAAVPRLSEIAKSSAHADVRLLAVESLGEIVPRIEAIVSALEAAMNDNDDQVRSAATAALHGGVPLHDQKRRPLETPQFELASTTKSSE